MLVYIRESDREKIICDLDDQDISEHLKVILVYLVFHFLLNSKVRRVCLNITEIFPGQVKKGTGREGIQEKGES